MTALPSRSVTRSPGVGQGGERLGLPALLRSPRAAFARLVLRLPVPLYRLGMGRLVGRQFLLLTHVGRRSGRIRETVLKVLHYDPLTEESVVVSAWGAGADWYRNIQAQPALTVRTAGDWYVPEQRQLPPDEAFAVFEDWTRRQRAFARLMLSQIGQTVGETAEERRALVARFPFVGLRPRRRCRDQGGDAGPG